MVERFQIYQLTVPVVPPGGVRGVPLQLDTDAPFALRLVKSRNIDINGFNFQTPRKKWQSSGLRTDWSIPANGGTPQPGRGSLIFPELVYPVGSQIVCDIGNDTEENILNARILFRGVKYFVEGALSSPTYPPRFDTLPFTYPVVVSLGLATSATQPASVSALLTIKETSDFVFRYGTCDPFAVAIEGGTIGGGWQDLSGTLSSATQPTFDEVYVILRDEAKKGYSNEPIHINDLFGQCRTADAATNGDGPMFPSLIVPEIYLPRNSNIYFDIFRYDLVGVPVDLNFALQGAKVFPR